jgi:HD-GYP domain-containing protein (c-di-GMP phosphodiesterase class II)
MPKPFDPNSGTNRETSVDTSGGTRVQALAELVNLASRLHSAVSIEELLDSFARGLMEIWPGAGIRLCEINSSGKCLIPLEKTHEDPIPLRGTLLGNVASEGRVVVVPDLDNEPGYYRGREAPPGLTWRSAITGPIPLDRAPSHVIGVFFPAGTQASESDAKLLERAIMLLEPLLVRWKSQDTRLKAFYEIAKAIGSAIDARDPHLVGHGNRVSDFAQHIARVHGLERSFIERLGIAGLLHDVGRLGIPETVLAKPGPLTPKEFRIIHAHPELSVRFLSGVEYLSDVFPAIKYHHERYDGDGYPDRLEADEIPLGARLLAVADAFDAMTSPRPFRNPLTDLEAIAELKSESGKQFDPILVEAFCRAYEEKLIISQNVLRSDDPLSHLRITSGS